MPPTADHEAREWDGRYGEHPHLWSGAVNATLATEVEGLSPGRAVDVCCGEGADAIWLARQGWQVTGLDISQVALDRAATAATRAGVTVEWLQADVASGIPGGAFDLVVSMYPAFRHRPGEPAIVALLGAVAPGGTLVVVHHDMAEHPEHPGHADEAGFDPRDFVGLADIAAQLGEGWRIEVDEIRPRVNPPGHGGPDVADVVLRARRTTV